MQIDRAISLLLAGHAIRRASWIGRKDNEGEILDRTITACDDGFCFSGRRTIFGREQEFVSSVFLNNADLSADDWEVSSDAAPQAVPAEDIAGLVSDLRSHADEQIEDNLAYIQRADTLIREAAAALTSLSARLAEAQGWIASLDAEKVRWVANADAAITASEAEAADLRRRLEEHRIVLAEARERINRYADTAAEHDLMARIDALSE